MQDLKIFLRKNCFHEGSKNVLKNLESLEEALIEDTLADQCGISGKKGGCGGVPEVFSSCSFQGTLSKLSVPLLMRI